MSETHESANGTNKENRYLLLDFWEFAVLSTLIIALFPWSLLYYVIFHGLSNTALMVQALFHDTLKTLLAVFICVLSFISVLVVLSLVIASLN